MSSDEEVRRFTDGEIVPIVAALRELLMCARKGPLVHDTECNRSFPTEKDSRGQIMEFPWTFHDHALMVNALNALPRLLTTVAALSAPPGKGEAREHDLARIIHNAVAVANGADPEAASRLFDSYEPESLRYEEWHAAARGALAGATTPILYGMFDGKGRLASHCPTRDLMDEFAADLNDGGKYAETKESSWIYEKPYTVVPLYVAPPAAPAACPTCKSVFPEAAEVPGRAMKGSNRNYLYRAVDAIHARAEGLEAPPTSRGQDEQGRDEQGQEGGG